MRSVFDKKLVTTPGIWCLRRLGSDFWKNAFFKMEHLIFRVSRAEFGRIVGRRDRPDWVPPPPIFFNIFRKNNISHVKPPIWTPNSFWARRTVGKREIYEILHQTYEILHKQYSTKPAPHCSSSPIFRKFHRSTLTKMNDKIFQIWRKINADCRSVLESIMKHENP